MEKGMTPKEINVTKRDGTKTPLDLDKVHRMVELACEGLAGCLLYTSPSPRDGLLSRMPSSA